jgi:RNA polymerase sigma factor (TIGR02999 family)
MYSRKEGKLAHLEGRICEWGCGPRTRTAGARGPRVKWIELYFKVRVPSTTSSRLTVTSRGSKLASDFPSPTSEPPLHWGNGDRKTLEALLPLVYEELRRLARSHLRQQRPNHTLQTTALVHEAYLRLAREKGLAVESRAHFLGIAAQLMRWILVDYERNRRTAKRGAGATRLNLDEQVVAASSSNSDVDLLALDAALHKLAELEAQQSRIIELRYFAGLSIEDTAQFLGVSPATVKRSWTSARAWLLREMNGANATP